MSGGYRYFLQQPRQGYYFRILTVSPHISCNFPFLRQTPLSYETHRIMIKYLWPGRSIHSSATSQKAPPSKYNPWHCHSAYNKKPTTYGGDYASKIAPSSGIRPSHFFSAPVLYLPIQTQIMSLVAWYGASPLATLHDDKVAGYEATVNLSFCGSSSNKRHS
jgi:hypothetical protein